MIKNTIGASLLALGLIGASSAQALVVVNGNFEAGNVGFTSTYLYQPPGSGNHPNGNLYPEETYTVDSNPGFSHPSVGGSGAWPTFPDHTPGAGTQMLIVNGGNSITDIVWQQIVTVVPNALPYFFEAWIANVQQASPAQLTFRIIDGVNTINLGPGSAFGSPNGVWQGFSGASYVPQNANVTLRLVNAQTAAFGNDFAVDDISFETERQIPPQVPEVSTGISAGVFALVGGLVVLRRRKAAQVA